MTITFPRTACGVGYIQIHAKDTVIIAEATN